MVLALKACFAFCCIHYKKDSRRYPLSKGQPKLAISIFANYKLGPSDFYCKLFYQTAKRTTNVADSILIQINYLVFDPEVFANFQIAR